MLMHDRDPDVVRWGLDSLIDVCAISNAGSCNSVTQYDTDRCQVFYVIEGFNESMYPNNVENDAVIAHALQEELSRVAAAEASGSHNTGQESILAQDWRVPHGRPSSSESENNQGVIDDSGENKDARSYTKKEADELIKLQDEEGNDMTVSNTASNAGENSTSEEEKLRFLDISDESALDGEVGKRINHMVPIPHVPKINGELPSEDEQVSDHQRLLDRLKVYDLIENKVKGDGNCQFRSLSDQLYRTTDHHKFVREQVVNQLKSHPEIYEGYVPMAYGDYLKKMSKSGEWGDHVTLQAAADSYGVKIFMITSFKDTCYIEILPQVQMSNRVICLSFWAEVHYNSIYPEGELFLEEVKKKKKWWIL